MPEQVSSSDAAFSLTATSSAAVTQLENGVAARGAVRLHELLRFKPNPRRMNDA